MLPVIRAPEADQDLADLADYLARRSVRTSLRFLDAAQAAFVRLGDFPELGSVYESSHSRLAMLRFWPIPGFERYLIFYRVTPTQIEIVRVVYGVRDLGTLTIP